MSVLEIKGLSHRYDDKVLFHDADLQINNGEHVGIVGLNGAGKSTFINILAGEVLQDEGEVRWQNNIRKTYLDQHAELDRSLTVMEYLKSSFRDLFAMNERMEALYAGMGEISDPDRLDEMIRKATDLTDRLTEAGFFELEANIKKIANGLGVMNFGYDTVIGTLSGGQRAKLMLAKLLLDAPDVMMLDEPTNFLDIEHIAWLTDFLNACPKTVLVISHDTEFLDRVCRAIVNHRKRADQKIRRELFRLSGAARTECPPSMKTTITASSGKSKKWRTISPATRCARRPRAWRTRAKSSSPRSRCSKSPPPYTTRYFPFPAKN